VSRPCSSRMRWHTRPAPAPGAGVAAPRAVGPRPGRGR
jgi:hypothetical protein